MKNRTYFEKWMLILTTQTVRALLVLTFALALTAMLAHRAQAQTYTVLCTFTGSSDGGCPYAGLILDDSGNMYGTTETRGDVKACGAFHGCGVVYKLDTSGHETVLHTFGGQFRWKTTTVRQPISGQGGQPLGYDLVWRD
jgi:hypothetical protein